MRHIVKFFDADRTYTEKEVNDVLKNIYSDYVLLRRYLIEYGLMDRTPDGSSYRVRPVLKKGNTAEGKKEQMKMDKRKELKLEYKQQSPPPMGVYQIKNMVNGKIFIGSSMNLKGSLNSYQFKLDFMRHHNRELKADMDLHGAEAFKLEILETIDPEKTPKEQWRDKVSALEEKWLNNLQPYGEKGYNKPRKTKKGV